MSEEQPHITIHEPIRHSQSTSIRTKELYDQLYLQSVNNPATFWGGSTFYLLSFFLSLLTCFSWFLNFLIRDGKKICYLVSTIFSRGSCF